MIPGFVRCWNPPRVRTIEHQMTQPSPEPSQATSRSKSRPKKRRRIIAWLLAIPLVLILTIVILAATGTLTGFVVPIIERETGLEMTQGSIAFTPTTDIEISDAIFRAPNIDGQGGELIRFDRATIAVRWSKILSGPKAISRVVIDRPHLRVSQDTETGAVNLEALNLQQSGGGGAATPAITINNGIVEIGEHTGEKYTSLKELSIVGSLDAPNSAGVAPFDFFSTSTEPVMSSGELASRGDFRVNGTISKAGVQGVMTGLTLEDWPAQIVPSRVRDTYESLNLTGKLAPTKFTVDNDGQPKVTLTLEGVDVSLPFIPPAEFAGPERYLRMRSTKGTINFGYGGLTAHLEGDIDQLLYEVNLKLDEYSQSSAFTCDLRTKFRIEEGFRPLRFLPERVTEKLDRFNDLKADIDATINLSRAKAATNDAPILVSGRAVVANGSAKYYEFMYPFENIAGVITFTPDGVGFEGITGRGPTGAKLLANGSFDGLGETSVVEILVEVSDLPIDQHLLSAMDKDQRDLVDTLFSQEQYKNLLESGFLLEPSNRGKLTQERDELVRTIAALPSDTPERERAQLSSTLNELNATLRVPEFDFGGLIEVGVTLRRHPERPENDRWTTDINALIPQAGIVPKQFPLPIIARDVNIEINDGTVILQGGRYDGLNGGLAEVDASFKPVEGFNDPQPYVEIKARNIPIDQRLIAAIPGYYDEQPDDPAEITLRRILDRLRMQGLVEADAQIFPGNDGRITYEVTATVLEGSAHPLTMGMQVEDEQVVTSPYELGLDSVQLADMFGTIYVTQSIIVVHLNGLLESPSQPIPPTPIDMMTQLTLPREPKFGNIKRVDGLLPFQNGPPTPGPAIYTRVRSNGLVLSMPIEHAIAVLSPSFAQRIVDWRNQYNPTGELDLLTKLEGRVGGTLNSELQINQVKRAGFSVEDHQYQLGTSVGPITLKLGIKPRVESRGFSIPISVDDEPVGMVGLSGSIRLTRGGQLIELNDEPALRLSMDNGRLGSPGVRAIVNRMGSNKSNPNASGSSFFEFYGLDGRFDMLIDITPLDGARISDAEPGTLGLPPVEIDGSLTPRTLSMQRDEHVLAFEESQISGSIRFDGLDGYFDRINAQNDDYTLSVDGKWAVTPGSGAWVDLNIAAVGDVLNGSMRVLLPDTLSRVVDQLKIESSRDIDLEKLHIVADKLGTDSTTYHIEGSASVLDASALVGVPITELDGRVDFRVETGASSSPDARPTLEYQLDLAANQMRAGLLRVHNAEATILNDPNSPGVVLVPELRAGMHGGMVSGNAQVQPDQNGEPFYSTEIRTSGVRAAPIFDDIFLPVEGLEGPPSPGSSVVRSAWNVDSDVSRGIMYADLAMTGPLGAPDDRIGRGYVRVAGGSIVALPGLINLIEASNLKLPTGSRLNLAEAEFYMDGPTLAFERLSASSDAIEILGYGTMDWTSRDIDLRFRSRSIEPIPILSGIIEGLRDELITIRVSGAPGSISYAPEQFGTTKRLLDSMFGTPETEQQRRLREVESRTRVGSGRLRRKQSDRVERPTSESDPSETSATADTQDD